MKLNEIVYTDNPYSEVPKWVLPKYGKHIEFILTYYQQHNKLPPLPFRGSKEFEQAQMKYGFDWIEEQGWKGKERRPLTTDPIRQSLVDSALSNITGHELRKQSVFVSNKVDQAMTYGHVGVVLVPNSGFDLYWINQVADLTTTDIGYREAHWYEAEGKDNTTRDEFVKSIEKKIRQLGVQHTNTLDGVSEYARMERTTEGYLLTTEYAIVDRAALNHYCEEMLKKLSK